MRLVKFTHVNNQQVIEIVAEKICGFFHSPAHQATFIVSDGQTVFPAKESVDEVRAALLNSEKATSGMTVVEMKKRPKGGQTK